MTLRNFTLSSFLLFFIMGCSAQQPVENQYSGGKSSPSTSSKPAKAKKQPNVATEQLKRDNQELSQKVTRLEKKLQSSQKTHQDHLKILEKTILLLEKSVGELQKEQSRRQNTPAKQQVQTKKQQPVQTNEKPPPEQSTAVVKKSPKEGTQIDTPQGSKAITPFSLKTKKETENKIEGKSTPAQKETTQPLTKKQDPQPLPKKESPSEQTDLLADPDLNPPKFPIQLETVPGAKRFYNDAYKSFSRREYQKSIQLFGQFIRRFPNDQGADNSQFWIGQAQFNQKELRLAEQAFRKVLKKYAHRNTAQGYKTPDAILMLGRIYLNREERELAKYYFQEVINLFPTTSSATKARRELQSMNQLRRQ